MVRKFAEAQIKPIAAELDRTHRHPEEILPAVGRDGAHGVAVPTEYDGAGMDNVTYVMALIEISKACASCGVIASVNNSLYGYPVKAFGTEEQKIEVPRPRGGRQGGGLLRADGILRRLRCRGAQVPAELKGDRYIVSGVKTFITSGNIARYCVLAATTDPARGYRSDHQPDRRSEEHPGVPRRKGEEKMGILASGTAELVFEEAEVPAENLLGKPGQDSSRCSPPGRGEDRHRRPGLRIGRAALEDAVRIRPGNGSSSEADCHLPGDPVQACRHGHRARRSGS